MIERLKQFFDKLNSDGLAIPMVRIDGKPSLTATFAVLSFNTALLGQIGKFANLVGDIDLSAANYLFFGCLACWLGKKFTGDKENNITDKDFKKFDNKKCDEDR